MYNERYGNEEILRHLDAHLAARKERERALVTEVDAELREYLGDPWLGSPISTMHLRAAILSSPDLRALFDFSPAEEPEPSRWTHTVAVRGRDSVTRDADNSDDAFCLAVRDALNEANAARRAARQANNPTY